MKQTDKKKKKVSHLQVDHEFNESLAVMHFVHGYGFCISRQRNHGVTSQPSDAVSAMLKFDCFPKPISFF